MTDVDQIALVLSLAAIAYGTARPIGMLVCMLYLTIWDKFDRK